MNQTIAARIRDTGGRTSGFDYLRIILSISVIIRHSTLISYGPAVDQNIWTGGMDMISHSILPIFFALSGFLVAGSLDRCPTLISFYGLRTLRIIPALGIEVLLAAIVFGPMLSTLDLMSYVSQPQFRAYFLNIVGDIHYLLPGVFTNNPNPLKVNGQLWTVPYELQCYAALGALVAIGIAKKRTLLLGVVILGQGLWALEAYHRGAAGAANGATGAVLVLSFLAGLLLYLYRDVIVLSRGIFIAAVASCIGLLLLAHGTYLISVPAAYITVYLGLLNPGKVKYLFSGDYSYGIYLYGYPVQQVFASLGPWAHNWYLNLLVCLPVTFIVAYLSWTFVEKPTLALRRYLPKIESTLTRGFNFHAPRIENVTTRLFSFCIFLTGLGSALLLLNADEEMGLFTAATCLLLLAASSRYQTFCRSANRAAVN